MTMTLVSTLTVGAGGAASIEFTSIPQTGTDLLVLVSGRMDSASLTSLFGINFNSSTTNYSYRRLRGSGAAASSSSASNANAALTNAATSTASTFGNAAFYIPNYAGTAAKSYTVDSVTENNGTESYQDLVAYLWNDTSSITSIKLSVSGANWVQYSTASLYTITKGSGGATVS